MTLAFVQKGNTGGALIGLLENVQGSEKSRGQLEFHVNLYNFISSGRRGAPALRLWHERQHGSASAIKSNYVISREILVVRDFFRYPVGLELPQALASCLRPICSQLAFLPLSHHNPRLVTFKYKQKVVIVGPHNIG